MISHAKVRDILYILLTSPHLLRQVACSCSAFMPWLLEAEELLRVPVADTRASCAV